MKDSRFQFHWEVGEPSDNRCNIDEDPKWGVIERVLNDVLADCGQAYLTFTRGDGHERRMELYAENGIFFMALGEDVGYDYQVRTFDNKRSGPDYIAILGNLWGARSTCDDPSIAIATFKEFFETGDVSETILN